MTAVEHLGIKLNGLFTEISPELWKEVELIFQEAKKIESEQMGYTEEQVMEAIALYLEGQSFSEIIQSLKKSK